MAELLLFPLTSTPFDNPIYPIAEMQAARPDDTALNAAPVGSGVALRLDEANNQWVPVILPSELIGGIAFNGTTLCYTESAYNSGFYNGQSPARSFISTDNGTTWTAGVMPQVNGHSLDWSFLFWDGARFVAIATAMDATLYYNATWDLWVFPYDSVDGTGVVTYGTPPTPNRFATSLDGLNWAIDTMSVADFWTHAAYSPTLDTYLLLALNPSVSADVYTTQDLFNVSAGSAGTAITSLLFNTSVELTEANGVFYAHSTLSEGSAVHATVDGSIWYSAQVYDANALAVSTMSICYDGNKTIAIGSDNPVRPTQNTQVAGGVRSVVYSSDGFAQKVISASKPRTSIYNSIYATDLTFTLNYNYSRNVFSGVNLQSFPVYDVVWTGDKFIGAAGSYLYMSNDGDTWYFSPEMAYNILNDYHIWNYRLIYTAPQYYFWKNLHKARQVGSPTP